MLRPLLWLVFACRCGGEPEPMPDTDPPIDTSVEDTADTQIEECLVKPAEIVPEDETDDHYYRDPMTVLFTDVVAEATFTLSALTAEEELALDVEWNDSGEWATLSADLQPNTSYMLAIVVCDVAYENVFATSEWGTPLADELSTLVDRTYVVELGGVAFTEPADFGAFLALYLDVPILIGVREVDEENDELSLIGAQGFVDGQGLYRQRKRRRDEEGNRWWVPTWDFESVDFLNAPFFSLDKDRIELLYEGVKIPVHDFHLEGTFSSDGEQFGEARLWGLADTRNMGELIDPGASDAQGVVCEFVAAAGTDCQPCPDDEESYCLFLRGESITAKPVPDLVIERIEEEAPAD